MKKLIASLMVVFTLGIGSFQVNTVHAETETTQGVKICNTIKNVPTNKIWKVTFNKPVDVKSLNYISVVPQYGTAVKLHVYTSKNKKIVYVAATKKYIKNHNYTVLLYNIKSTSGQTIKPSYFTFKTIK